jgi:hypothetical protein
VGKSDRHTAPGPLADFDPEIEALLAKPGSKTTVRLVLLWIVVFVAAGALQVSTRTFIVIVAAVFATIIASFLIRHFIMIANARRLGREVEHGRLGDAVAWHERAIPKAQRGLPRVMLAHDLGYYELRRGNLERALAIHSTTYMAVQDLPLRDKRVVALNQHNLAINYAARGDIDAALAWLPDPASKHSLVPTAAVVVYARRGEWDRVLALEWPELQPRLEQAMRHAKRIYAAVRAMASLAQGNDDIEGDLEVARLAYDGELDYLATDWPELREIIARLPPPLPSPDAEGLPKSRVVR